MKEKEFEIRGRETLECIEMFAKGFYFPSNDYIYGGLFWTGKEDYARNWSILIYWLLKREKSSPEDLKAIRDEMAKFLQDPNYQLTGVARYERDLVVWMRGFRALKGSERFEFDRYQKGKKFNLVVGRVAGQELDKRSGLVFLKLVGEDGTQVSREKIWEGRKKVLEAWESLTDDPKIKDELSRVGKFIQVLEDYMSPKIMSNPLYLKLVGYVAPFEFKGFSDSLLVSRARLFWRRKTAEEIIEELKSYEDLWKDLLYTLRECLYKTENEEVAEQKFLEFLKKWESEEFLKELRKDWKETLKKLLKGERKDFLATFVRKEQEEGKLTYGTFFAPSRKIKLYIFYERDLEKKLDDFREGFKNALSLAKKKNYVGNAEIELVEEAKPIDEIIPNLEKLKKLDLDNLKHQDSLDLLFSLLYFACWIKNLKADMEKEKNLVGALLLLNTDVREENGGYDFWEYFRFVYDFFGIPVQTLNKQTIEVLSNPNPAKKQITSIFKNLFISLLKDYKGLSFEFEGFELPQKLNIYLILEKPSTGFCYQRFNPDAKPYRHFLYEIYLAKVEENKVEVEVEDKIILLTGGLDFEKDRLRRWIEEKASFENVRFCFITAGKWENSYLEEIVAQSQESEKIKQKSLFVEYSELPTAYISEGAEKDCFVIYTTEFERLKERLKIKNDKISTAIAIKPVFLHDERFALEDQERFYHSALQVFSTKGPGWEREEVYSEKKNLFLFSVLSLSLYESESFRTPYSKLDLWQKKKTVYLNITRNHHEYKIPLNSALYEMLYLLGKIPDL